MKPRYFAAIKHQGGEVAVYPKIKKQVYFSRRADAIKAIERQAYYLTHNSQGRVYEVDGDGKRTLVHTIAL